MNSTMRIFFCGTPQFAVPTLKLLLDQSDFTILGVITQPDRPRGRGHEISLSPVKQLAVEAGLPVHQPEKIRSPEIGEILGKLELDFIVIIAYGQIIPSGLLSIPRLGWINLHASLLPKYRGAAPINWAIADGESVTGLTTMRIDAGMDTGDILRQEALAIGSAETAPELASRMAEAGAPLMVETLRGLAAGAITPRPQNHDEATFAPLLKKQNGRIDWPSTAQQIFNRMRAFTPWPGSYTSFRGHMCHLWGEPVSDYLDEESHVSPGAAPGTVLLRGNEVRVVCGGATQLHLLTVKLEGRKQVAAVEFVNGAHLQSGERFGES